MSQLEQRCFPFNLLDLEKLTELAPNKQLGEQVVYITKGSFIFAGLRAKCPGFVFNASGQTLPPSLNEYTESAKKDFSFLFILQ